MPIFDYTCKDCKITKEYLLKLKDDPPKCNECGIEMKKEVCSPKAFKFIGAGFYSNDYK